MISASARARQKLALDENSFQQLLAAAYVLQKHNDSQPTDGHDSSVAHLAKEIAALRSRIVCGAFDLPSASVLIANSLRALVRADGVSICLVRDGYLNAVACSGTAAKVRGGSVAANSLIATERLRNGHPFQSSNARADIRLDWSVCPDLQLGSLLAVPIERGCQVAGLLELRWRQVGASKNCDQRVCQLTINLLREAFDRERGGGTEHARQSSPSSNASSEAAVDSRATVTGQDQVVAHSFPPQDKHELVCRTCCHPFASGEEFCGNCGVLLLPSAGGDLQSKWASLWFMQQAQKAVSIERKHLPLHAAPQARIIDGKSSARLQLPNIAQNHPETDGEIAPNLGDIKRKSGSVISILTSRLKSRASAG